MTISLEDARRHPSAVLLAAQLLAVLLYPFFDNSRAGRAALGVIGIVILMLALWAVRSTPVQNRISGVLAGATLAATIAEWVWFGSDGVILTSALIHMVFYFFVSYGMVRYLFEDEHVTRDELYATGAAFTVVAWAFSYAFTVVQVLSPGSFSSAGGPGEQPWFNLLFLSFTNLACVGLSDLTPAASHARSLIMVEQVVGVFYVALVVARLVGLAIVPRSKRD